MSWPVCWRSKKASSSDWRCEYIRLRRSYSTPSDTRPATSRRDTLNTRRSQPRADDRARRRARTASRRPRGSRRWSRRRARGSRRPRPSRPRRARTRGRRRAGRGAGSRAVAGRPSRPLTLLCEVPGDPSRRKSKIRPRSRLTNSAWATAPSGPSGSCVEDAVAHDGAAAAVGLEHVRVVPQLVGARQLHVDERVRRVERLDPRLPAHGHPVQLQPVLDQRAGAHVDRPRR